MRAASSYEDRTVNFCDLSVLLVEDDELQQQIYQAFLRGIGFGYIKIVSSAEQAFEQPLEEFALIISDFDLGNGQSGIKLAHYIRQNCKALPFLLMSTDNNVPIFKAYKEYIISDFLQKPFSKEILNKTIKGIIFQQSISQTSRHLKFSFQKFIFFYQHFLNSQLAAPIRRLRTKHKSGHKRALVVSPMLFEQKLLLCLLKRFGFEAQILRTKQDLAVFAAETFDLVIVSKIFEFNPFQMDEIIESMADCILYHPVSFLISSENKSYKSFQFKFDHVFYPKFAQAISF